MKNASPSISTNTPSNANKPNVQRKPPYFLPSPSNNYITNLIRNPLEYAKAAPLFSPNNYYSNSNTKNGSSIKTAHNESFNAKKTEKSQNSLTDNLIQNLEEKYNNSLKENFDLHQSLNEKSKSLAEEKKANFILKAKIRELEGVLSIYMKEKSIYEDNLKEKDEEIEEIKTKYLDLKEKYMKASYLEIQIENYKEIMQELQSLLSEKTEECDRLAKEKNIFPTESNKIPEIFKEIFGNDENLNFEQENFFEKLEENLQKTKNILLQTKQEKEDLNKKIIEITEKQNASIEAQGNKHKTLQDIQIKQLREIDKKNKADIEKLFNLINLRKKEIEKLQETNKILSTENADLKEKYNTSTQKMKNLENYFSKAFKN